MVDLASLRSAQPDTLDEAARSWQTISTRLDDQVSALRKNVISPLTDPGTWTGSAAGAAVTDLDGRTRDLIVTREYADTMTAVMRDAATGVSDAQAYLRAADDLAASNHLTIGSDGSVAEAAQPPLLGAEPASLLQAPPPAAEEVSALIKRAVALADQVDAQITARLRQIGQFAGAQTGSLAAASAALSGADKLAGTFNRAAIPAEGTDPAEVNAWWKALSAGQRQQLISQDPSQIGWLDGVPATDRNAANTLALEREQGRLQGQLQSLERNEPPQYVMGLGPHDAEREVTNPAWQQWNAQVGGIKAQLAQIDALESGIDQARSVAGAGNVYLLGFNTNGNGHAIVAVGNPDTADNTVTYVPGLGSTLSGSAGDIGRATTLWQQAEAVAPGKSVSSIYWLNYNAPQLGLSQGVSNFDTASTHDAVSGAPALTRFEAGLGATHQAGVPDHTVVLGHSYGSLVVGEAAARDGMHPGDIITVGSPGVGVNHAAQLGIPPSHVWAGANSHDPVPDLANPWTSLNDPNAGWFGNNPASSAFGGQVFNANDDPTRSFSGLSFSAHSSYWDPGSSSLNNMAKIVDGQYARVGIEHLPPSDPNSPPNIPLGPGGI